jgi:hypothetical protein
MIKNLLKKIIGPLSQKVRVFLRNFAIVFSLSLILTLLMFFKTSSMSRSRVDAGFPPQIKVDVQARGWPFPFLADDPGKDHFGSVGFEDRFFWDIFWMDWACIFILVIILTGPIYMIRDYLTSD